MIFDSLKNLNINFYDNETLENFIRLFKEYNLNVNLMSKNDTEFLFEKHIYDSLAFNLFYEKYLKKECGLNKMKLLDIGTGGGFPAVPIAIFFKNIDVWALDSTLKKIKFIEFIKEQLNLENLNPICKRAEELEIKDFDVITSRAMAELRVILEYAIPNLKEGAFFAAYKSVKTDEEIKSAKNALEKLNSKIIDVIQYSLPLNITNKRVLVIVKKIAKTPNCYPRKNGLIIKKPL